MSFVDSSASDATTDLVGDVLSSYVLLTLGGRSIGGIIPNVTIQEVISDESTITQHPVESGAAISDHVFTNPVTFEALFGWSDSSGAYPGYINDIYQALLALRDTRQPFDIYTPKRMLGSMLFGNITVTTDETSENALMVRARFQQVIITSTTASTSANQQFPQQTNDESNMGNVPLQPASLPGLTPIGTVAGPN